MANYYLMSNGTIVSDAELYHYGIPGMKWGIRKAKSQVALARTARRQSQATQNMNSSRDAYKQAKSQYKQAKKAERSSAEAKAERAARAKRAAKIGAAAAVTALAVYGAYKLNKYVKTKNCQIAAQRGYDYANKQFDSLNRAIATQGNSGAFKNVTLRSGAADRAKSYAKAASEDKFRTAAKNVINYKRSGGNLRNLRSVSSYNPDFDQFIDIRR